MACAVSCKVDEGAKRVPGAPMMHARHHRAQVPKARMFHEVAHGNRWGGQVEPVR